MIRNLTLFLFSLLFFTLFYFNNRYEWFMMNERIGVMHFVALAIIMFALTLTLVFRRSRLFFMLLLLFGLAFLAELFDYLRHTQSGLSYRAFVGRLFDLFLLTFTPLAIISFAYLKDRGVLTSLGWVRILGVVLLWLLFIYILLFDLELFKAIQALKFLPFSLFGLPDIAFSALFMSLILFIVHAVVWPQKIEYIYLMALLGVVLAALLPKTLDHFIILTTLLSLLAVIDIISRSYHMAYIDELTGLKGRRAMNEALIRLGSQYTLVMGDIDHFKKFNDTYGHDVGDEVLKLVATEVVKVKGGGEAYRWGGEEFVLLFPGKEAIDTIEFVEKVRQGIEKHPFFLRDKSRPDEKPKEVKKRITSPKTLYVTMSFGVASKSKADLNAADVMKRADKKLYAAKEAGRNCVIH